MNSQKKAFTYAFTALAVLAVAMVAYYYFEKRLANPNSETAVDGATTETAPEEKGEFIGTYAPDGPLEAGGKRIAFFTVNYKEDGGYLGSAKVDTIGSEDSFFFNCVDVRIDAPNFFLSCEHATEGSISLSGTYEKKDSLRVKGKVLWTKDGASLLQTDREFSFAPN